MSLIVPAGYLLFIARVSLYGLGLSLWEPSLKDLSVCAHVFMLFSKVYWSLTSSNEYRTWGCKNSCISSSNTYICIFYMRDWGNISIPAPQGRMPVSCSFLLKVPARLHALSADSVLPARAHLFTEMRPPEGYHVGVQILGFYLNVWAETSCSTPRRKSFDM